MLVEIIYVVIICIGLLDIYFFVSIYLSIY